MPLKVWCLKAHQEQLSFTETLRVCEKPHISKAEVRGRTQEPMWSFDLTRQKNYRSGVLPSSASMAFVPCLKHAHKHQCNLILSFASMQIKVEPSASSLES